MRAEKEKTITKKTLDNELKITNAKADLIKVSKSFYEHGWMLGTSGNLSILIQQEPLHFLITASGKDKGELTEEDFIVVDKNGCHCEEPRSGDEAIPIEPLKSDRDCHASRSLPRAKRGGSARNDKLKPSAETLLHSAIYKHTDANAVFHVHTTNSTLLSMHASEGQGKPCPYISFSGLEMLKGLGFKTHDVKVSIPIIENSQDMKYLASIASSYINEDIPGLLLKGHGIYAWGKTVLETKRHVEIFEFLFEYRVKELSLVKG